MKFIILNFIMYDKQKINLMILFKLYNNKLGKILKKKSSIFFLTTIKTQLKFKINVLIKKKKLNFLFFLLMKHSFNIYQKSYINKNILKKNKRIFYIFIINFNYKNVFFNVINNKCNKQIFSISLGLMKYKSLDNISKKYLILQILKKIKTKTIKNTNIAIHIDNKHVLYVKLILNFLKKSYLVQKIKYTNNLPHNGCRPKKKLRK